jgi:hypothetical protein
MKNCNDTIGNRTRDLPACSTVPQPTAPLRTKRLLNACLAKTNLSVIFDNETPKTTSNNANNVKQRQTSQKENNNKKNTQVPAAAAAAADLTRAAPATFETYRPAV